MPRLNISAGTASSGPDTHPISAQSLDHALPASVPPRSYMEDYEMRHPAEPCHFPRLNYGFIRQAADCIAGKAADMQAQFMI